MKGRGSAGPPGAGPQTEIPSEEVCAEAGAQSPEPRGGPGPGRPEALAGREALEAPGLRPQTPTPRPGPRDRRQHQPLLNRTRSPRPSRGWCARTSGGSYTPGIRQGAPSVRKARSRLGKLERQVTAKAARGRCCEMPGARPRDREGAAAAHLTSRSACGFPSLPAPRAARPATLPHPHPLGAPRVGRIRTPSAPPAAPAGPAVGAQRGPSPHGRPASVGPSANPSGPGRRTAWLPG